MEIYINADKLIVGRIASYTAKKLLLGETIKILNCDSAVITGNRQNILSDYKHKQRMTKPTKGPFFPTMPDRFVRRVVRGMLPFRTPRGKDAFKRVMCYVGVPDQFKDKKMITLPEANVSKIRSLRFLTVREICRMCGGKL